MSADGTVSQETKYETASFGDLFALTHVDLDYRHRTMFCRDWYVYTIEDSYIIPKWFEVNIQLPRWDVSCHSAIMNIRIEEYDPSKEVDREITISESFMENFTFDINGEAGVDSSDVSVNTKIGYGYGSTSKTETSRKTTIKSTEGSDLLCDMRIHYCDSVIDREDPEGNGYYASFMDQGEMQIIILPSEYQLY